MLLRIVNEKDDGDVRVKTSQALRLEISRRLEDQTINARLQSDLIRQKVSESAIPVSHARAERAPASILFLHF